MTSQPRSSAMPGTRRSTYNPPPARLASPALIKERSKSPNNKVLLAPLRQTRMVSSKPVLPAELLENVIDNLPTADMMRMARVSRRMQEMVYDDTRWAHKLNLMGLWNESEARKRFEETTRRKREAQQKVSEGATRNGGEFGVSGHAAARNGAVSGPVVDPGGSSTTMFDHGVEEKRQQRRASQRKSLDHQAALASGFDAISLAPNGHPPPDAAPRPPPDAKGALNVLKTVRSIRGGARQEYGRVYGALAPYYFDLARARSHTDPALFKAYRDPEEQAHMLHELRIFAKSDTAHGWQARQEALDSMIGIFENAVLREFEQGYSDNDVDGRMKRYAHVLVKLNGGAAGIDYYIHNHPLMLGTVRLDAESQNLNTAPGPGLSASNRFFDQLLELLNKESGRIEVVFPESVDVLLPLLDRICEDVIAEFVTPLFDEAHKGNLEDYLNLVAGVFQQSGQFVRSLRPTKGSPPTFTSTAADIINRVFEPHIDLYLEEELDFFTKTSTKDVDDWELRLREQETSQESFYMSNVTRAAAKQDFLTSFKKVLLMPVNAIETSFSSIGGKGVSATNPTDLSTVDTAYNSSFGTPSPAPIGRSASPSAREVPTTELAAKAAIMNSKLEGIATLFSLEVALNLVHRAKISLERAASFVRLGGHSGEEAKEQCEAIFVHLVEVLGFRHIKVGFDKAVSHLSTYNAREAVEHGQTGGVKPLVTFLELVNVGDLIQQMVDAFYVQELVAPKLTDRDDFLNQTVKEKKRFEQMLDERVAAGLNRGIDVLMDEVEFVCATTQQPTDYNPAATPAADKHNTLGAIDIGPTPTAQRIVDLVSSHTSMLIGTADKNTLDVFNTEVGLRLFSGLCKHLKRQRVSTEGAIKLISDTNHYFAYAQSLKNRELLRYFRTLREVAQIFLVDGNDAKEIATLIADQDRFQGVMPTEEVLEFAERRADWYQIRRRVEGAMFGMGCNVM